MAPLPSISIIGSGKVGTALGILAAGAGYHVAAVAARGAKSARRAAKAIGPGVLALSAGEAATKGDIVLLTVPDDAIAKVCAELAGTRAFKRSAVVAHCSGALGSDVLAPAAAVGCRTGSLHPLQTFPTVDAAIAAMSGAYAFIEGDTKAVTALTALATAIGLVPVAIPSATKALYHASAVMACNYLVTLMDVATQLAVAGGVPPEIAFKAIEPMVRAGLDNVSILGPAKALTGPIARGDVQTIERHLAAMTALGEPGRKLADLYRALAGPTIDLAIRKGTIDDGTAKKLRQLVQ